MNNSLRRIQFAAVMLLAIIVSSLGSAACGAKNVILMISDGAGFNVWMAADMQQGKLGSRTYDQSEWRRLGCTTYPLTLSPQPTGAVQDESLVYDSTKAWDASRTGDGPGEFAGYKYQERTATDSAAAGTALATGRKTYCGAINWSKR